MRPALALVHENMLLMFRSKLQSALKAANLSRPVEYCTPRLGYDRVVSL